MNHNEKRSAAVRLIDQYQSIDKETLNWKTSHQQVTAKEQVRNLHMNSLNVLPYLLWHYRLLQILPFGASIFFSIISQDNRLWVKTKALQFYFLLQGKKKPCSTWNSNLVFILLVENIERKEKRPCWRAWCPFLIWLSLLLLRLFLSSSINLCQARQLSFNTS